MALPRQNGKFEKEPDRDRVEGKGEKEEGQRGGKREYFACNLLLDSLLSGDETVEEGTMLYGASKAECMRAET